MMMIMSVQFGTLVLLAWSGSCSGVERGGGGGCQEPVCPSSDSRCGELPMVTVSGKIASTETSCQAPLADEEVRLYMGCAGSAKDFNVEPAAGWKTGKDGTFEVSIPFQPGTSLLRTELCLTPRRACQPLTLNIPAQKDPSYPDGVRYADAGATSAGGRGGVRDGNKTVRVNVCLGEKKRRRRLAGWGDRDMSWLKKKSTEKEEEEDGSAKKKMRQDPGGKKRGWSNGIPWLKRRHPSPESIRRPSSSSEGEKRLWEGADDEVGWIKRHSAEEDAAERERPGENLSPEGKLPPGVNLSPNDEDYADDDDDDDGVPNDGRSGRRRSSAAKETVRSGLAAGRWPPRPEEMKKYWAQSDMSWL